MAKSSLKGGGAYVEMEGTKLFGDGGSPKFRKFIMLITMYETEI